MRLRSLASGLLALAVTASIALACSKGTLEGQGGSCNLTTDCQPGLVCIPEKSGGNECSSSLGSIQQLPPVPDAGTAQASSDASDDGPGVLVGDDAGGPIDSGAPAADTGTLGATDASGD